jgi:hypothetical protein
MQNIARMYENQSSERFFGAAHIVKTDEGQGLVVVALTGFQIRKKITARLAIELHQELALSDEVLVVEDNQENFFVIGVLNQKRTTASSNRVSTAEGTYALKNTHEDGETLGVYSKNNELLFEYNSNTKKAKVFSEAENVVFEAPKGNIEFNAAGKIHFKGHRVELYGRSGIGLSVGKLFEKVRAGLTLKPGKIDVSSQEIKISARRAGLFIEEARNNIKTVFSRIGSARLTVGKLETTASSIIEKTENAYRTIEKLNQVKSGRMRMLIHNTFHLKSKTTVINAEDDVKVKGEKIHLG